MLCFNTNIVLIVFLCRVFAWQSSVEFILYSVSAGFLGVSEVEETRQNVSHMLMSFISQQIKPGRQA